MKEETIGFVGLGMMGNHMAANILKVGRPLVAYDVDSKKNDQIAKQGAQIASDPAGVAQRAQTIISMVDTTAQAEEVIVGPRGFIQSARPGDVIISMSTIDPLAVRRMHQTLAEKGVGLIDAPVSGMEERARLGTLRCFVGGDPEQVKKCMPTLEMMASEIRHLGPVGQGVTMKLVNNMLVQVGWIAISEALTLGAKAGLDPKAMVEIIRNATGNSFAFEYMGPRVLQRDFDGARLDITYKDLELQTSLARSLGVPVFLANIALQVYQMGRASGLGSEDGVAIIKIYEQMAGVSLSAK